MGNGATEMELEEGKTPPHWVVELLKQQDERYERLIKQQNEQYERQYQRQEEHQKALLAALSSLNKSPLAPMPLVSSDKQSKLDRWTMPFLVGACSGLVWIMQNGFVPFYNSFGAVWLGMFYGPALIGYLIYVLGCAMEQKRYHSEHPEAGGLHTPQIEKINSECMWLGLKVALSLLGAQVMSRIFFANGLAEVIEKSMGGWSGRLLETMPIEFHIGMMLMSAVGFACCFAALSYYQKGKLENKEILQALGVGLFAGAGVYIAHLLPGMNAMYGWDIPLGVALILAAVANAAVLTIALAMKPSLVDVSGLAPAPVENEATKKTVLMSTSSEKLKSTFNKLCDAASEKIETLKAQVTALRVS